MNRIFVAAGVFLTLFKVIWTSPLAGGDSVFNHQVARDVIANQDGDKCAGLPDALWFYYQTVLASPDTELAEAIKRNAKEVQHVDITSKKEVFDFGCKLASMFIPILSRTIVVEMKQR